MNQLGGFPLLTLIVFLPALGALASLFVPAQRREALRWLGLLVSASDLFVALFLYMGWLDDPLGRSQFVDGPWTWVARLGITYHLGIDGSSLHLILLAALVTPLLMILCWTSEADPADLKNRIFWVLLFEAGLLGTLTALDLFLMSGWWLMALLAATLFSGRGTDRTQASAGLLVVVALTAVLLLAVSSGVWMTTSNSDLTAIYTGALSSRAEAWMFWAMVLACEATGAVFPLHIWYPMTQRNASPAARVLMGSLLLNLGSYGLIRVCLQLFPLASIRFAPLMIGIGTAGLLYGTLAALAKQDIAGTLAYWRIAQAGWTVVGIFSMDDLGLYGAILHLTASSLVTAALLLLCVQREAQTGDRHPSSWSARTALSVSFLSAMGMPGLMGFIGQGPLLLSIARLAARESGSFSADGLWNWVWIAGVVLGIALGMWALLRAWRQAVAKGHPAGQQVLLVLPILLLIVLVGLRPSLTSDISGPSVHRVLVQVRAATVLERPSSTTDTEAPAPLSPLELPGVWTPSPSGE